MSATYLRSLNPGFLLPVQDNRKKIRLSVRHPDESREFVPEGTAKTRSDNVKILTFGSELSTAKIWLAVTP